MKNLVILSLFFISLHGVSQTDLTFSLSKKDSIIIHDVEKSFDYFKKIYDLDSSIAILTEAIKIDTSFFEIYFLRGICYDIKSRQGDSSFIEKAMNDYARCMFLKLDSAKAFPDTLIAKTILWINPHPSGIIADIKAGRPSCYAMLRGVSAFLRSNGTDRTSYCKEWKYAYEHETPKVKIFIDKYCE